MKHEAAVGFGHAVDTDPIDDSTECDDPRRAETVGESTRDRHAAPPKQILDRKG